jgi:hypothetical protein
VRGGEVLTQPYKPTEFLSRDENENENEDEDEITNALERGNKF